MPPRRSAYHPLAHVVERNISSLLALRRERERQRTVSDRIADWITAFVGTMGFFYAHIAWFTLWIAFNTGLLGYEPFDPFPFGFLTLVVSLEAIFLSTCVLISQNRLTKASEQKSDLDLQINLLSEYEVTKILRIIDAIADHLKLEEGKDPELQELEQEIVPERLLKKMSE